MVTDSQDEVERMKAEIASLRRQAVAKDRLIRELVAANERIIASAPLTDAQRADLAGYVANYLDRGVRGVWHDLATGIAALMAENERLARCVGRPPELYRLLDQRDLISADDEMLCADCQTWCALPRGYGFVGSRYDAGFFVPMRRRVP
jgi:hypothetical protein